ncbi:hypothetical protein [Alloalcanivorax gelatiniphagus]|uniref:Uncharacterized protein n=1 Tax=Alloalcanivorax gelatiniphagus TaxID=1194167 RepID=A0ABY2XMM5_9GAMM|nr:hypothetical protein [Alloalcanivorax gelatiniphagus]TMW13122.1 hypothetical protein FGS76_08640 [Alloalcanivorax gelatiniphagus]|tara:strand:+ start:1139 stop:1342 length:204 start_codon:yes stop_codon:yes gene_type:complete
MLEQYAEWLPLAATWVLVCTLLSFLIARHKGMRPLVPTAAGFVAAFIPIVGLIYLIVLGMRETPGGG